MDIENVYNLLSLILHELAEFTILLVRSLSLQIWFKFPYVSEITNRHDSHLQKWRPRKANRNIKCKTFPLFFQKHVDTPITATTVNARRNRTSFLQNLRCQIHSSVQGNLFEIILAVLATHKIGSICPRGNFHQGTQHYCEGHFYTTSRRILKTHGLVLYLGV